MSDRANPIFAAAAAAETKPPRASFFRKLLRLAALASTVLLALALFGYVVRDRTRWLALLMYLPMVIVAPAVILTQVIAYEEARWKRRVGVIAVALVAGVAAFASMRGGEVVPPPADDAVRALQWNVQWGKDALGWVETVRQVEKASPDIFIVSEAPAHEYLGELCTRLGGGWSYELTRTPRRSRYQYRIAVASRWPIEVEREIKLPNGGALAVTVRSPKGPIRVLAVDGISDPKISRTPMLAALAEQCAGYDIVGGDFNAVARSVGFDRLEDRFRLASRSCDGWRGTYPSYFPLYDIDHVWVRGYVPVSCRMLTSPGTNHRGQLVYLHPSS